MPTSLPNSFCLLWIIQTAEACLSWHQLLFNSVGNNFGTCQNLFYSKFKLKEGNF